MTESHGRIIRKRNPGMLQPDEEVTAQFVVREHELATALEILRGNVDADSCQHTLIVAPRGRGKTMLLARIAAELRADAELASCLLPVRFMEESDEVFSAADFWLEALFYLALAIDKPSPEFARSLRDTREDLASRWRERELDERARAAVLEAADTLGMRLVLMVENLQALCANADPDFGWKLRKTLQTEPQIILVATATSRFEGLDDAREPFFELFRIISLAPLNTAQCRRLWEVVSGDTASEREIRPLRDPDRRFAPLSGHRRRIRAPPLPAPVDGRAGATDRRSHRYLPRRPAGSPQDRAPRISGHRRPLAAVEHGRDRRTCADGRTYRLDHARAPRRARRGDLGRSRQEAPVRHR